MRTAADALRSLKRYTALVLDAGTVGFVAPDPRARLWEVRLSGEKGDFHRPFARVHATSPLSMVTESSTRVSCVESFQIVAYPAEVEEATEALMEAERVRELLWFGFGGPGVDRGRLCRVPLYDYDGLTLMQAADETRRDRRDFMRVTDSPNVNILTDPDDAFLTTIAAELRMSWLRSAAVASTAIPTRRVLSIPEGR